MPEGAAETSGERRAGLDKKLEKSLSEFDEMLLGEKETLSELRPEAAGAPSADAAAGGPSNGMAGGGDSGAEGESAEASGEGTAESRASSDGVTAAQAAGEVEEAGAQVADQAGEAGGGEGDENTRRVPPDIPSGEDDDIVARQLREAAMEEDDPELREKLWEEYRRYKTGQRRPEAGEGKGDG